MLAAVLIISCILKVRWSPSLDMPMVKLWRDCALKHCSLLKRNRAAAVPFGWTTETVQHSAPCQDPGEIANVHKTSSLCLICAVERLRLQPKKPGIGAIGLGKSSVQEGPLISQPMLDTAHPPDKAAMACLLDTTRYGTHGRHSEMSCQGCLQALHLLHKRLRIVQ